MFRYIALIWDESRDCQSESARILANRLSRVRDEYGECVWKDALFVPGMRVLYTGARQNASEPYPLPDAAAVVLGTVFEPCREHRETPPRKMEFSAVDSRQVLATGARSLVSSCWGRYVAFAHDATQGKSYVMRDPTGGLPCYRTSFRGVDLYFSSIEDCVRLDLLKLSINWEFIASRLVFVFLPTHETAISEVTEVLAGEHLEIHRGKVARSFAWNPLDIASKDMIESAEIAAREMRWIGRACIHAWAARYKGILHTLSGGLDSSIVLACLQDAPTDVAITCLTYYSSGCDGDERHFARLAADRAGCRLIEWERNSAVRLEDLLEIERTPVPSMYLGPLQTGRAEAQLARDMGIGAIFGGGGGDQLFYQEAVLGAVDYLQMRGFTRRFIEVALDAAQSEHCSIWHVIRESFKQKYSRYRSSPRADAFKFRRLLTDETINHVREQDGFKHPLFESAVHIPPGKLLHAYSLSIPHEFYDPLGLPEDPERVEPLNSQPLIELCLRIPTYVLAGNGWDRAVARRAFREDLPREILRRRSKGGIEEHVQRILMRNIDTARDLLLNGQLARRGLLDRSRVEEVLSGRPTRIVGSMGEIFDHLSTEVWLRRWSSLTSSALDAAPGPDLSSIQHVAV